MTPPRDPSDVSRGDELTPDFFRGQARDVATDLIGTLLLVEPTAESSRDTPVGGIIVEAEAYVNAADPSCHLAAGRTPRTEAFFSGAGTIYVYSIHGHAALNFISEYGAEDGNRYPEGILVRAIEPTHGRDVMRERRGFDDPRKLASGPGKLTQALGISKAEFNDEPIWDTRLDLYHTDLDPDVKTSARVGVTSAENWPLRFTLADSDYVSQPIRDEGLDYETVDAAYSALDDPERSFPTVD